MVQTILSGDLLYAMQAAVIVECESQRHLIRLEPLAFSAITYHSYRIGLSALSDSLSYRYTVFYLYLTSIYYYY